MKRTVEQRFWNKVDRSGSCWIWLAYRDEDGYGRFDYMGAHQVAFRLLRGQIPPDRQIDHLCRNRACVNPAHMELVTPVINTLRGEGSAARFARRIQCGRGHPFSGANLAIRSDGTRKCRLCHAAYMRAYRVA